jgi:hypothetical protein
MMRKQVTANVPASPHPFRTKHQFQKSPQCHPGTSFACEVWSIAAEGVTHLRLAHNARQRRPSRRDSNLTVLDVMMR